MSRELAVRAIYERFFTLYAHVMQMEAMRDCITKTHEEIETMIVCCFERTSEYNVNRFED